MARNSEIADLGAGFTSATINSTQHIKKNPPLFFSYYITGNEETNQGVWQELGGANSGSGNTQMRNVVWTKQDSTGVTGSTEADPMSKFNTATGRFTPGVSGFYHFSYYLNFSENLSDGAWWITNCCRNGVWDTTPPAADIVALTRSTQGSATNPGQSGSGCINLDTNDYVSIWLYQTGSGDNRRLNNGRFSGFYLGENF